MNDSDTLLVRAVAAVAGMQPGEIARKPAERARQLIRSGYAFEVESLDDRLASEPPNRHLDRPSLGVAGAAPGPDTNPLPRGGLGLGLAPAPEVRTESFGAGFSTYSPTNAAISAGEA